MTMPNRDELLYNTVIHRFFRTRAKYKAPLMHYNGAYNSNIIITKNYAPILSRG